MAGKKRKTGKYEADLVKTYHQVAGKPKKAGKKVFSTILIILIAVVFVAAIGGGAYLYFFSSVTPGLILNNVSILDISIGGMTKSEAAQALQTAFQDEYCAHDMTVTMYDKHVKISSQTAGLKLDTEAVVEAAYNLGRTSSQVQRKREQMQSMAGKLEMDPSPYLSMDTNALKLEVEALCAQFSASATDNTFEITGEAPDLYGEEMPEFAQVLVITSGTPGYAVDAPALLEQIRQAYLDCSFSAVFNGKITEPVPVDLEELYSQACSEPINAEMDKETFEVSAHTYGYAFDLDEAIALQKELAYGESCEIPFVCTAPDTTTASLESLLFRDVLGSYTAYSASDPYNRDVNLKLSCQAIDGTVLMPGEIFSYNPALGERTPEAGWKQADGYVGTETVKEYGGGICQASSCLYLSALLADLEIVERVNHGFISAYMPYGMDATVSWGGPEFRFKNSTEYPLRIEAVASGGAVTVRLIGTDTKDYYIRMTYEVLKTDPFETVYQEMPADNEDGYVDGEVIVSGYTGYVIRTYRCKYSKSTDQYISSKLEAESTYNRRDKIICKIVEEETTEPSESTPTDPTEQIPTESPEQAPTEDTTVPTGNGSVTEDG